MRFFTFFSRFSVFSLLLSQSGIAQEQCLLVEADAERLACYDAAFSVSSEVGTPESLYEEFLELAGSKLHLTNSEFGMKDCVFRVYRFRPAFQDDVFVLVYIEIDLNFVDFEKTRPKQFSIEVVMERGHDARFLDGSINGNTMTAPLFEQALSSGFGEGKFEQRRTVEIDHFIGEDTLEIYESFKRLSMACQSLR